MRLALVTYSTRPRGGVVHTLALAEALAELGLHVTVVSLARHGDVGFFRAIDPRVEVRLVPFPDAEETVGQRIMRSIECLRVGVDWTPFDLVHAQDCISANAVDRCIRTIHHIDHFTTPELVACHERAIVRPFAHICVSHAVAEEVAATYGIRATVIPNGVDAGRFARAAADDATAAAHRAAWRDRIGGPYVLSVGGIEPRKGTRELVEAFAAVTTALPDHRLVIAGGETLFDYRAYRAEVDARAVALGVQPIVLGAIDDGALPSLVAGAAVVAQPSTKEGFGLAAMEALAAGVPLVLSDLAVFREVFGRTALFGAGTSGLAASIARGAASTDPGRQRAGRTLAWNATWDAAATAHREFYATL